MKFILFFFTVILTYSQYSKEVKRIDHLIESYHSLNLFNGSAIVAIADKVLYEKSFGYADIDKKIINSSETVYTTSSITKQFTAAAILKLAENGKLKVTDHISMHLPQLKKSISNKITIHQLLTHTSGLSRSHLGFTSKTNQDSFSNDEIISLINNNHPQIRSNKLSYSNLGYVLLAIIIENVSGREYGQFLEQTFFKPLKMTNTSNDNGRMNIKNRANGLYNLVDGSIKTAKRENKSFAKGAGSVHSTTKDMFKWARSLQEHSILSKKFATLLFNRYAKSYGYGWVSWNYNAFNNLLDIKGGKAVTHGGTSPGFRSAFTMFLDHKITIVLLGNFSNATTGKIFNDIGNILLGGKTETPTESLNSIVVKTAMSKGIPAALEIMRNKSITELSSSKINSMGYAYLNLDLYKQSITIFKLNTELFKTDANTYDSLAEAYYKSGKLKHAEKLYKKSYQLNKDNHNALTMIKKIYEKLNP
jgi:CubicO group peptidase (beta-lactamase class C family)